LLCSVRSEGLPMGVYESKWVRQIVALQQADGSWGHFHTLSRPTPDRPITTEQALRRLRALGLTRDDEPIQKALAYMRGVLLGSHRPPDRRERVVNWDAFEKHIMAAWILIFQPDDPLALPVARMWAEIAAPSFHGGTFDIETYADGYRRRIPALHAGERLITPYQFYMVNLLKGQLDRETEARYVDSVIGNPSGIYYVYGAKIADLPAQFASRQTGAYLAALEQLAGYACAGEKLRFAVDWLLRNRDQNGEWDIGTSAKDGVNFPLSDSWRNPEDRRRDCTARIEKLLKTLETRL
jgi:hypothetical protein